MNFKYYDLLSSVVLGYVLLCAVFMFTNLEYDKDIQIGYLAISYVIGYYINALGSWLTPVYNRLICGKPSDVLLTPKPGIDFTGYSRVKFYRAKQVVELLKKELGDENATTDKMFNQAMIYSNGRSDCRVPDFYAQYGFSRTLLTVVIAVSVIVCIKYYYSWYSYVVSIIFWGVTLARYKERGYYYAREVLNEYIKTKSNQIDLPK